MTIAPPNPSHVLPGLMRGIILCLPISEPTAYAPRSLNLVTGDEIEHDKSCRLHVVEREVIDLLDEVQQPRDVHQAEQRRGDRQDARGVACETELAHAQVPARR